MIGFLAGFPDNKPLRMDVIGLDALPADTIVSDKGVSEH